MNFSATVADANLADGDMEQIIGFYKRHYWTSVAFSLALVIIGLPGNLLTMKVLTKKAVKDNFLGVFLRCLCVLNLACLIAEPSEFIYQGITGVDYKITHEIFCFVYTWFLHVVVNGAVWMQVVITAGRMYLISRPERMVKFSSPTTAYKIIIGTVVVVTILKFFDVKTRLHTVYHHDGKLESCDFRGADMVAILSLIAFTILPGILFVTFNCYIVVRIRGAKSRLLKRRRSSEAVKKQVHTLVFASNALFGLTVIPEAFYTTFFSLIFDLSRPRDAAHHKFVRNLFACIMYVSNACNIFIYCFFGSRFRVELFGIVYPCIRPVVEAFGRMATEQSTKFSTSGYGQSRSTSKNVTSDIPPTRPSPNDGESDTVHGTPVRHVTFGPRGKVHATLPEPLYENLLRRISMTSSNLTASDLGSMMSTAGATLKKKMLPDSKESIV